MIRVKIYSGNLNEDICSIWRAKFQYSGDFENIKIDFSDNNIFDIDVDKNYDIVIFIRFNFGYEYLKILQNEGVKVVFDYDDVLPLSNAPDVLISHMNDILHVIKECDMITTTNERLKTYFQYNSHNSNIEILPNIINPKFITQNKKDNGDKIILGWYGTWSHYHNLTEIKDIVIKILDEYENVYLNLYSDIEEIFDLFKHPKTNKINYNMNFDEFQESLGDIDINLAPIRENYVNLHKSDIRLTLVGYKGIPSVASNFGSYKDLGIENVLLCDTKDEWYYAIKSLIENVNLRKDIGENIKNYVCKNLVFDKWKERKKNIFENLKRKEHFYHNIGEDWFTYPELYSSMVKKFDDNSKFVEIGVWKGRSAAYIGVEILNSGKNISLDCIDVFSGSTEHLDPNSPYFCKELIEDENWLYNEFIKNTKPISKIINPIKAVSWEAAELYEDNSLDFVFLDAAHDYESVKKDLKSWFPKIREGGVFAGHDYPHPEVYAAVSEFFGENKVRFQENCWVYDK